MRFSREVLVSALALALFGLAVGCATNPVTGKQQISIVSDSQEMAAGKQALTAAEAEYGFYADAGWSSRLNTLGQKLAAISHRPTLAWDFHVVDDPTVNAFAAPGGHIFVTRGILAHLNSEAQLAGVVGHEIGHVTARHYATQASREMLANLGLGVASVFSPTVAKFGQVAQAGLGILFLKYSRDQENEADQLGVQYSFKAGWDPREMPQTYRTLARIGQAAGRSIPNYLSTHPDPGAREVTVRQQANAIVGARTGLTINHDSFLRSLDGMVFGEDPQQGYFEGDRFYHPDMAFQMDFPAGWTHQNSRQNVYAGPSDQSAVMQLSLASLGGVSPAQYVAQLQSSGKIAGAQGRSETVNGRPAWLGRITVQDSNGQTGTLALALVSLTANRTLQILGQTRTPGDAAEQQILDSARSIRTLTEAGRLSATPAHLKVVVAPRAGAFQDVVPGLGAQGLSVDQTSIINGMDPNDPVRKGQLLKIVTPGRFR